jgi:hypothetical protein
VSATVPNTKVCGPPPKAKSYLRHWILVITMQELTQQQENLAEHKHQPLHNRELYDSPSDSPTLLTRQVLTLTT